MSSKRDRAKRRGVPRDKTPGMKKEYLRQIGSVEASGTAGADSFVTMHGMDSTNSRPSLEAGVEAPESSVPPPRDGRPLMPRWASIATVCLTAIGIIGGALWFVASMKSDITENRERIRSLERSYSSLQDLIRHEVGRLERSFEQRFSEIIAIFQGQPRMPETKK